MFEDIKLHFSHYLVLFVILLAGLTLFLLSSHESTLQLQIVGIVAFFYFLWGIVHHFLEKNLTWFIVLEYLGVAALSLIIIYSLLARV